MISHTNSDEENFQKSSNSSNFPCQNFKLYGIATQNGRLLLHMCGDMPYA